MIKFKALNPLSGIVPLPSVESVLNRKCVLFKRISK